MMKFSERFSNERVKETLGKLYHSKFLVSRFLSGFDIQPTPQYFACFSQYFAGFSQSSRGNTEHILKKRCELCEKPKIHQSNHPKNQ